MSTNVTPSKETIAELFELAIVAEKAAEALYRGVATRFAAHQDVADFWKKYAAEEAGHARQLENLQATLSPEQLSAPADLLMLEGARKLRRFSAGNALNTIKTLQDAYELANELENSEINVIFEFLITDFSSDKEAQSFLRSQLKDHIARLILEFPPRFSQASSRQALEALK